jgi:hypothetical protein
LVATSEINAITVPDSGSKPVVHEDLLKIVRQMVQHEVMTFANAAERTAVFGTLGITPNEGAYSYLQDVDRFEVYNGGWMPLDYQELIDAVDMTFAGSYVTSAAVELDIGRLAHTSVGVINGQLYKHDIQLVTSRTTITEEFEIRLRKGTPLTGTLLAAVTGWVVTSTAGQQIIASLLWPCTLTETTTLYLSVQGTAAAGELTVYSQIGVRSRSQSVMTRMGRSSRYRTISV